VGAAVGDRAHAIDRLAQEQFEDLMRAEHDIWLREHLLKGYEWAEKTQDALRLHRDIVAYDQLPARERALDALPIQNVVEILRGHGYIVVNKDV
jgi:RyR domain